MKIVFGAAFAAFALLAFSVSAPAQSVDAIVKRLEALEKENSALRQRVHRLEAGKQRVASAQPSAPVATATPAPLFNSPAMTAQASAHKAPMGMMMPSAKWNGFYIGAHGGYAFSNWLPPTPNTGLASNVELRGGFGGIQFGYNIQLAPHWLIGVEQDISIGKVASTRTQPFPAPTITAQTNAFGTVRGRFGYIWNDILLYETAGVAWAYNTGKLNFNTPAQQAAAGADALTYSESHLQWGVAVGAGIEWYVRPNLSVKGEVQYIYLTKEQYFAGTTEAALAGWPLLTARAGLNWHFN
jgi:outer membrane immunogenic protein